MQVCVELGQVVQTYQVKMLALLLLLQNQIEILALLAMLESRSNY
jgi:hypothetical protein